MKNLFLYAALALSLSNNLAARSSDDDQYANWLQDITKRVDSLEKQLWRYRHLTDELEGRIRDLESRTKNL
jgi:hypothetical protein